MNDVNKILLHLLQTAKLLKCSTRLHKSVLSPYLDFNNGSVASDKSKIASPLISCGNYPSEKR